MSGYDIRVGSISGRHVGSSAIKPEKGDLVMTDEGERRVLFVYDKTIVIEGREPDRTYRAVGAIESRNRDLW